MKLTAKHTSGIVIDIFQVFITLIALSIFVPIFDASFNTNLGWVIIPAVLIGIAYIVVKLGIDRNGKNNPQLKSDFTNILIAAGFGQSLAKKYSKKLWNTPNGRQFMVEILDHYLEYGQENPEQWRDETSLTIVLSRAVGY